MRPWVRPLGSILAGMLTVVALWLVTGLAGTNVYGARDNADGWRIACQFAMLATDADSLPTGGTAWAHGVVVKFDIVEEPCPEPHYPTSRLFVFDAVVPDSGHFDLRKAAKVESLLLGLSVGCGVFVLWRWGSRGVAAAALVVLAAIAPVMARFLISQYSEYSGLIGAVALLMGIGGILANSAEHRWERGLSVLLVLFGSLYGGLAKLGNAPLIVVGALVLLCTTPFVSYGRWRGPVLRGIGPVLPRLVAVVLVGMLGWSAVALQRAGAEWSEDAQMNFYTTSDYVLGAVAAEYEKDGGDALKELGLPETLRPVVGLYQKWPNDEWVDATPDWKTYMGERGADSRGRATRLVIENPRIGLRMTAKGVSATGDVEIDYLTANQVGVDPNKGLGRDLLDAPFLRIGKFAALGGGVVGLLTLLTGMLIGPVRYVLMRRRTGRIEATPTEGMLLLASLCGFFTLSLVLVAVYGDGYFELAKHVWLAAFFQVSMWLLFVVALLPPFVTRAVGAVRGRSTRA